MSGAARTPSAAAVELGVTLQRHYVLEARAPEGLLQALEPGRVARGARRSRSSRGSLKISLRSERRRPGAEGEGEEEGERP